MSRKSERRGTRAKPGPPPDDPEQSNRFIAKAQESEADPTAEVFEQAFRKIALSAHPHPRQSEIRARRKGLDTRFS
jgi:hypothetical protein